MTMERVYNAVQEEGMDKNISLQDFLKFDEIVQKYFWQLINIEEINNILEKPLTKLKKAEIDFVLNYEINLKA
ncbi:hypothetical protein [Calidifontibacillus erzurumensis]|uniref:hypothetical protein n=1 Tax=Calidifontibacillus erzurumensis TaxID=2741433 RepID=UPI0035B561B0